MLQKTYGIQKRKKGWWLFVVELVCQRCKHRWNYKGANTYWAQCPHCRTLVKVKKVDKV